MITFLLWNDTPDEASIPMFTLPVPRTVPPAPAFFPILIFPLTALSRPYSCLPAKAPMLIESCPCTEALSPIEIELIQLTVALPLIAPAKVPMAILLDTLPPAGVPKISCPAPLPMFITVAPATTVPPKPAPLPINMLPGPVFTFLKLGLSLFRAKLSITMVPLGKFN